MINPIIFTLLLLIHLPTSSTANSQSKSPFSSEDIIQLTTEYQHKFPIIIENQFSSSSDLTVVITSCNGYDQLQMTLNSFFHFNTYVLNKIIIVEDCFVLSEGMTVEEVQNQIIELLPSHASKYPQFFKVILNSEKLGQIASIDKAYGEVTTKYVYHLEDDWIQLSGYGMLQRMKDVLEHASNSGWKVSQVVQTIPNWGWNHFKGPLQWTNHQTKYYQVTSYGKQWLYSFSFNPHLINFQELYKKQLNSSLIQSIAKRYHCLKDENSVLMEDGGCVQHYLGVYLSQAGYKQVFMEEVSHLQLKHIGNSEFQKPEVYEFEYEKFNRNEQTKEQEISKTNRRQVQQANTLPPKSSSKLSKFILMMSIGFGVALLIVFYRNRLIQNNSSKNKFGKVPSSSEQQLSLRG